MGTEGLPDRVDVVIVGGGFAGAATACALARRGVTDVLVLEAEDQFGVHATGLNAALARQLVPDPVTGALLRAGNRALHDPAWEDPVDVRPVGSLLLVGDGAAGDALLAAARAAADAGLDCAVLDPGEAAARVPVLDGARFRAAVHTASDGVVDIHALLWRYLRTARRLGARLAPGTPVTAVEVENDRVVAVATPRGRVACSVLVDAAGAWANDLAALAGVAPLPMVPFRRHLAVTPPLPFVDPAWPFVWHATDEWYFRPEVGGLLLCPCDQQAMPPPVTRDPGALELLAEKLAAGAPRLANLPVKHWWAGLRTLSRDGRFLIGREPALHGFVWVAGLGGHGMTASAVAGELGAAAVLGEPGMAEVGIERVRGGGALKGRL